MRIFAEASDPSINIGLAQTMSEFAMQHFSGFHNSMDQRCALPRPYLSYYPALYPQSSLHTAIHILSTSSALSTARTTPPPHFAPLTPRENYDVASPTPLSPSSFGPTQPTRLGDIVLARSGDKGGNANIGFFVSAAYHVERVEFAGIGAVHFVVYGILGRGVEG